MIFFAPRGQAAQGFTAAGKPVTQHLFHFAAKSPMDFDPLRDQGELEARMDTATDHRRHPFPGQPRHQGRIAVDIPEAWPQLMQGTGRRIDLGEEEFPGLPEARHNPAAISRDGDTYRFSGRGVRVHNRFYSTGRAKLHPCGIKILIYLFQILTRDRGATKKTAEDGICCICNSGGREKIGITRFFMKKSKKFFCNKLCNTCNNCNAPSQRPSLHAPEGGILQPVFPAAATNFVPDHFGIFRLRQPMSNRSPTKAEKPSVANWRAIFSERSTGQYPIR